MPYLKIDIPDELFSRIDDAKPEYLDRKGFVCLILDSALDKGAMLPTCRAGAGNRFGYDPQLPYQFPPELEVTNTEASTEAVPAVKPKSWKPKSVNAPLKNFESLILEFWRVKKGSKGETAWKRLQGQLQKFLDAYGDDVVKDQLELAINGKWAGIEFSRYEQFKPVKKPWQQEPEMKHPAHRDFTAERIAAEQEGNENFLGF